MHQNASLDNSMNIRLTCQHMRNLHHLRLSIPERMVRTLLLTVIDPNVTLLAALGIYRTLMSMQRDNKVSEPQGP